jgi:hypothetical protein
MVWALSQTIPLAAREPIFCVADDAEEAPDLTAASASSLPSRWMSPLDWLIGHILVQANRRVKPRIFNA